MDILLTTGFRFFFPGSFLRFWVFSLHRRSNNCKYPPHHHFYGMLDLLLTLRL
jgi:hypothetical protein